MNETLICRLCLYNNDDYISIFSDKLRENKIREKLDKYLGLEIKEDDTFPKLICVKCLQTVENFHAFFQEVAQNQTVFVFSQQPIIINDHASHTTYILQEAIEEEEEVVEVQNAEEPGKEDVVPSMEEYHQETIITMKFDPGELLSNEPPSYEEVQKTKEHEVIVAAEEEIATVIKERPKRKRKTTKLEAPLEQSDGESDFDDGSDVEVQFEVPDGSTAQSEDDCDDAEVKGECFGKKVDFFEGFPTKIIQDTRLLIRGKALTKLMAKFFRLECDICLEEGDKKKPTFKKLSSLATHYISEHSIKGYVICCGIKMVKPRAMAMHMARHLQPEAFRCPECNKLMTCPKILQYHIQNHLPEERRPLACPLCPRRFSYGSALVTHAISHQPEKDRTSHICDECGKTFTTPGRLSTHISVTHTKHDQSFVCHVCAKQFTSKGNLAYHLTTHQPRIHQVQCEQCGKWLKNKLCLRKHMVQHSMIRHLCHLCEYSALNMQCLRNHIRVQHTDIKPFSCEVCCKTFKLKNTLLNHMVQHTGVKKFSCQFCTRTFASSGNYYSHRKRMHPVELAAMKLKKEEEEKDFREKTLMTDQSSKTF